MRLRIMCCNVLKEQLPTQSTSIRELFVNAGRYFVCQQDVVMNSTGIC